MPRKGFKKSKDPWAGLDKDFRDAVPGMDEKELRNRVAQVALNQEALEEAKTKDADYQEAKDRFSNAGAVYRDGKKRNKLMTKYLRYILDVKCKPTGDSGLDEPAKEIVKDAVEKLGASLPAGSTLTVSAAGKTATIKSAN